MEPLDPYAPPQTESLKPLGSLAQSARDKQLRQAQVTLIVIGILTMGLNGFLLYNLPNEIEQAIVQNNVGFDQQAQFRQNIRLYGYLIYGIPVLLGLVFIVLGLIVKKFPVPITIAGLVLYVGAGLVFGLLNPASLGQGLIVKIIIVIFMVSRRSRPRALRR